MKNDAAIDYHLREILFKVLVQVAIIQDLLKHWMLPHALKLNRATVLKSGLIFGD